MAKFFHLFSPIQKKSSDIKTTIFKTLLNNKYIDTVQRNKLLVCKNFCILNIILNFEETKQLTLNN